MAKITPRPPNAEVARYLSTINLSSTQKWDYELKTLPRPTGRATRAIITEYDLPDSRRLPHDAVLDDKGMVWYNDFHKPLIGRMDPRTGETKEWPLPRPKPDYHAGTLQIDFDRDGYLWIALAYQGGFTRFDPRTENFVTWLEPPEYVGAASQFAPAPDGTLWFQDNEGHVSWDPFQTGKTAVRGGFGMFDVLPLPYQFLILVRSAAPFIAQGTVKNLPAGSFYAGAFPLLTPSSLGGVYVEHQPKRNYVLQWNLNVQHEFTPNLTGMVGYVGSRGVHQPSHVGDMDMVIPALIAQGYLWPSPVGSGTTINPNFGTIESQVWAGNSFFDALELQLTKRMSRGLQLQGSYAWGKSVDTSSSAIGGDLFGNSISSLHWFDWRMSRALSDFNIGRTLVINSTWQVPTLKAVSGSLAWAVDGWELGGIYKASGGVPFTATFGTGGDPLGIKSSDPWDFPNRLLGLGCNSLISPGNPNNYIKTQCFAIPTAPSAAFYNANCDPSFGTPTVLQSSWQCGPQHPKWSRDVELGFLTVHKQPHQADFRELQRAVPCRVFQHPESSQLFRTGYA
jgi:hypothetical protein